jgi:hypothetical protein
MAMRIIGARPHRRLTMIALERGRSVTGTAKVRPKRNLARNVAIVEAQICLVVCVFSDSSET